MEKTNINNGTDPTVANQTTVDRTERNKKKTPILSDRETDLSKIIPRMWWKQISKDIDLTYQKKLEELIKQGTDSMDLHTTYHIKGDVIWALGPKAKHEIMRGKRTQRHQLTRTTKTVHKGLSTNKKHIP